MGRELLLELVVVYRDPTSIIVGCISLILNTKSIIFLKGLLGAYTKSKKAGEEPT